MIYFEYLPENLSHVTYIDFHLDHCDREANVTRNDSAHVTLLYLITAGVQLQVRARSDGRWVQELQWEESNTHTS